MRVEFEVTIVAAVADADRSHPAVAAQASAQPTNKKAPTEGALAMRDVNTNYFLAAPAAFWAYFWRNFSIRPPLSTTFCLPV